jgi:oxygen-independent coproporphyrinogen-3 oxidase
MDEFIKDGLIELKPFQLKVTDKGRDFIRNICMAFDARLWRNLPTTELFSSTV